MKKWELITTSGSSYNMPKKKIEVMAISTQQTKQKRKSE
jgi:hypothetical protein